MRPLPDVVPVHYWREGGVLGVYIDERDLVCRYYEVEPRARNVLRRGIEEDE